jgi:hypothetical protein
MQCSLKTGSDNAPVEMTSVGSFWGHKGLFEDIGAPSSTTPDIGARRAPVHTEKPKLERNGDEGRRGSRVIE